MKAKHEDIIGRYMYITYEGVEYRLYYEESGNKNGIPLIMGHSASAQGNEYRFIMNDPEVAKDFYMIAFDLPYHGKSLPPYGENWWEKKYTMTTTSMCAWPNMICEALELSNPVYMGMSMGGHLAIDLALYHPDKWLATIGLEGSLKTDAEFSENNLTGFDWQFDNPMIGGGSAGAAMQYNMSPYAEEKDVKEIQWIYNQACPGVFSGDVDYYNGFLPDTHNVTLEQAATIDTEKCMVYLLTGEYDPATPPRNTEIAAKAIKGSYYKKVPRIGHFPCTENYPFFKEYLTPVLEMIKEKNAKL